jgi:hypothetical protein
MLSNFGLNRCFWAEDASTTCYLINRSPADYSQLRVFGCTAYAHVDNGKLEPRAVKCIFLDPNS